MDGGAFLRRGTRKRRGEGEEVANFRGSQQKGRESGGCTVTLGIGGGISLRCYPQTRGFGQFIPRDEAGRGEQACPAE